MVVDDERRMVCRCCTCSGCDWRGDTGWQRPGRRVLPDLCGAGGLGTAVPPSHRVPSTRGSRAGRESEGLRLPCTSPSVGSQGLRSSGAASRGPVAWNGSAGSCTWHTPASCLVPAVATWGCHLRRSLHPGSGQGFGQAPSVPDGGVTARQTHTVGLRQPQRSPSPPGDG